MSITVIIKEQYDNFIAIHSIQKFSKFICDNDDMSTL